VDCGALSTLSCCVPNMDGYATLLLKCTVVMEGLFIVVPPLQGGPARVARRSVTTVRLVVLGDVGQ
jgi:hypothetical protein